MRLKLSTLLLASMLAVSYVFGHGSQCEISGPNNLCLSKLIAASKTAREIGLSNRDSLPTNQAMLFIFERSSLHGIWMKDMRLNLDVIWLDKNKMITKIENDMQPVSFPKIYEGVVASKYIIETNAGTTLRFRLKIGDYLEF